MVYECGASFHLRYACCRETSDGKIFDIVCVAADAHPVLGGVFPPPPAAADLLLKLPPPHCFNVSDVSL